MDQMNNRIDEIMNSLEGMQSATASPHLYTRLRGKLGEAEPFWMQVARFLSRPAVAVALSLLLVLINIWFTVDTHRQEAATEQITDLAVEYHLSSNNLMDQTATLP